MQIDVRLEVSEAEDQDPEDRTGLTQDAYDRLVEALADAGFLVVDGPSPLPKF